MITLADVDEMVADLRAGDLTRTNVLDLCLELLRWHGVEEVLSKLPADLGEDFVRLLREDFDNAVPAEKYIWFSSGRGDQPDQVLIITKIRAWLQQHPASTDAHR